MNTVTVVVNTTKRPTTGLVDTNPGPGMPEMAYSGFWGSL